MLRRKEGKMKKFNAVENDMMELALNIGVMDKKWVDFIDETEVSTAVSRRARSRAEKVRLDAFHRVTASGKKRDRNRKDYKSVKIANEFGRCAKLYNSGNLDRTPFKVRRETERVIDEMTNSLSDAEYVAARLEREERIRQETIRRKSKQVNDLRNEAIKMIETAKKLNEMALANLERANDLVLEINDI
jgi:hypothetical protein